MGHSRKEEIAKLKREKRAAKAAKRRQKSVRDNRVRFLIVCEGIKTEPNYFRALIADQTSLVREVYVEGEGCATVALVNRTLEIKNELELENDMQFDRVWVVFDKDDFEDFNEAILLARKMGFRTAWTNEAFELWYYLHFEYLDTAISRHDYIQKLENFIGKIPGYKHFKYKKNAPNFYNLLQKIGNEELAKRYARKLRGLHKGTDYAKHKPRTDVDFLVDELEHSERLLN
ncbi:MAG: RloB domain-containing protein [Bacteroidales bacterium]|nr:RloB domain-containing protein [Bacteroidales bacterium]